MFIIRVDLVRAKPIENISLWAVLLSATGPNNIRTACPRRLKGFLARTWDTFDR